MNRIKLFESFVKDEALKTSNLNIPFSLKENEVETKVPETIDGIAVQQVPFNDFKKATNRKEGLVLLGTGGDVGEWVEGVTKVLNDEGIAKGTAKDLWSEIYVLTTTDGRTDTALVFGNEGNLSVGKLAMWRLRFGDASWISDYVVNYAKQHH